MGKGEVVLGLYSSDLDVVCNKLVLLIEKKGELMISQLLTKLKY